MAIEHFSTQLAGRELKVTIGQLAQQANGSCLVQYGETVVLATAVLGKEKEGMDYFPLMINYEERFYAAGKIKGSRFIKRETRPSDEAVLAGRVIDRSIRPLFNQDMRCEIQVVVTILAIDQENDPAIVGLYATSLALAISDIPWNGPIAGLSIGQIDNKLILNPTKEEKGKSAFDVFIAGKQNSVLMIEAGANETPKEKILEAITFGAKHLDELTSFFTRIQQKVGLKKNLSVLPNEDEEKVKNKKIASDFVNKEIPEYFFKKPLLTKANRVDAVKKIEQKLDTFLITKDIDEEKREKMVEYAHQLIYQAVSQAILSKQQRIDGRAVDEVRPLDCQIGVIPRVHGSAIFQRGETQVLSIITLGSPSEEQLLDTMELSCKKRFFHHYNFPPYSTGEVSPMRSVSRRSIGHGSLAEKGLQAVMPAQDNFPYTIRAVSEVMSSNGSSSMGSTCASSLALMDAGVPVKPVAGIAIGLASEEKNQKITKYQTFTELQDLEDGPGGMDFKVTGTRQGITAIQMDTKTNGLSLAIVKEALDKAQVARYQILDLMQVAISQPHDEVNKYAPKIVSFSIDKDEIRNVIGPGGRVINDIIDQNGVKIDINDDGFVVVSAVDKKSVDQAVNRIKEITKKVEIGEVLNGKVVRILDFGAFVSLTPSQDGLVHISELAPWRVNQVKDIVNLGDIIPVKVIKIDVNKRVSLSLKEVWSQFKNREEVERRAKNQPSNNYQRNNDRQNKRY